MTAIYNADKHAIFIGDLEIKSRGPYSIENEPIKPKKILLNCKMTLNNGIKLSGKCYLNSETKKTRVRWVGKWRIRHIKKGVIRWLNTEIRKS